MFALLALIALVSAATFETNAILSSLEVSQLPPGVNIPWIRGNFSLVAETTINGQKTTTTGIGRMFTQTTTDIMRSHVQATTSGVNTEMWMIVTKPSQPGSTSETWSTQGGGACQHNGPTPIPPQECSTFSCASKTFKGKTSYACTQTCKAPAFQSSTTTFFSPDKTQLYGTQTNTNYPQMGFSLAATIDIIGFNGSPIPDSDLNAPASCPRK